MSTSFTKSKDKSLKKKKGRCSTKCYEKSSQTVCGCAIDYKVLAPGVEMKLYSKEGVTYKWSVCPAHADPTLHLVDGQNCINRYPSLKNLDSDTGAYDEVVYTGTVVQKGGCGSEIEEIVFFHIKIFDVSCQPCDYSITPSSCVLSEVCPEITIEYCGSNFGDFDPTSVNDHPSCEDDIGFSLEKNWKINGNAIALIPNDTFSTQCVKIKKPCFSSNEYHNMIVIKSQNIPWIEGRNVLSFSNVSKKLNLYFFFIKCE